MQNKPNLWAERFPWPALDTHKHRRGRVIIVSGPATRTGAARLAARAALRIGAGLVTVYAPASALAEHAAQLNAIMLREMPAADDLTREADKISASVIGPATGVGKETCLTLEALAAGRCGPIIVDADALTSFADNPTRLFRALRPVDVLTPHDGEFSRLFPDLDIRADTRMASARAAASRAGCNLVLKGPRTLIADPCGQVVENATGSPFLATAGSGDVLAGMIAGLAASGMPTHLAACAAVWMHGKLGERLGAGLIAEDLPDALPALLNQMAPDPLKARP